MSLDDFLALPETKPYREFVDGEVFEKSMPNQKHSRLVREIVTELTLHLRETNEGSVDTELRHTYVTPDEERSYLPDVSIILRDRLPPVDQNPVEVVPDFVVEVLSPDDRPGRVAERVQFYLRAGVRLVWLVDPETEEVTVLRPDAPAHPFAPPRELSAAPVLLAFSLDLERLFAAARATT